MSTVWWQSSTRSREVFRFMFSKVSLLRDPDSIVHDVRNLWTWSATGTPNSRSFWHVFYLLLPFLRILLMYTTLTQTNIASTKNRFTDHILVVMSREDLSRWLGSFSAIPPRNRQVGFSFTSSEVKKANPPTVIPWGSEMDIVSFVDNFVGGWLRDTRPNSTQAEISDILATANRVKQAFPISDEFWVLRAFKNRILVISDRNWLWKVTKGQLDLKESSY